MSAHVSAHGSALGSAELHHHQLSIYRASMPFKIHHFWLPLWPSVNVTRYDVLKSDNLSGKGARVACLPLEHLIKYSYENANLVSFTIVQSHQKTSKIMAWLVTRVICKYASNTKSTTTSRARGKSEHNNRLAEGSPVLYLYYRIALRCYNCPLKGWEEVFIHIEI
jgi:hypothetical protein